MSYIDTFRKTPDERLDYTIDWTAWLPVGDTIDGVPAWTVPAGLTLDAQAHDTQKATAWITSGVVGQTYTVVCRVTTAEGRVAERTIAIVVVDRR